MNHQHLKDFFHFNKGERRGILFLAFILILVILLRIFWPLKSETVSSDLEEFIQMVDSMEEKVNTADAIHEQEAEYDAGFPELLPVSFDPNTVSRETLFSMGLPARLVNTFMNYRRKGGRFYQAGDVMKIYGMNDSIYTVLAPYIHIEVNATSDLYEKKAPESNEPAVLMIELNAADTSDLIKLWGIGPVFSSRIVKYRDLLGGFYSLDQLKEVYGLDEELFDTIRYHLHIDTNRIHKMNLNQIPLEDLAKHPYLRSYQARTIVDYRTFVGRIGSLDDLVSEHLLSGDDFSRIRPYLEVNQEKP